MDDEWWGDLVTAPTTKGGAPGGPVNPATLKKQFASNPVVDGYTTQVPILASAAKAPMTPAGDLDLIYAMGKILDPGSVVREGEMALAQNAAPLSERLVGDYMKQVKGDAKMRPKARREMVQMLANRVAQSARAYNSVRGEYSKLASSSGVDPDLIVGTHPGDWLVDARLARRSGSGKTGPGPAPGGPPRPREIREGTIAKNQATGERMQMKGGRWVKL